MQAVRIRKAEAADMRQVALLAQQLAVHVGDPDPGADSGLLREAGCGNDPWFECLVAELARQVVGFALFSRTFEAHTREKRLWLSDLCVAHEWRRQGVGQLLLRAVLSRAAGLGCTGVDLVLARGNELGRGFYAAFKARAVDDVQLLRLSAGSAP